MLQQVRTDAIGGGSYKPLMIVVQGIKSKQTLLVRTRPSQHLLGLAQFDINTYSKTGLP
jgi:hypothetical protein